MRDRRPTLVAVAGVAVICAALVLTFGLDDDPEDDQKSPVGEIQVRVPPRSAQVAVVPPAVRPAFDVVRVNPAGDAVIAGRAAAGGEVTVLDGGMAIGRARADSRGEWVFVPLQPLSEGPHELSLRMESSGAVVESDRVVTLTIPKRGQVVSLPPAN